MPTVVVEVNGRVVERYEKGANREAFELAWKISKQYGKVLDGKGYWEIYVETGSAIQKRIGMVIQMDLDGNEIAEFESAREAARVTGIPDTRIARASKRESQTGGFLWKRAV